MMGTDRSPRRVAYVNVIAVVTVFVVLGGGSFAVGSHLTVTSSDIVDGAIRPRHIEKDAVRPRHLIKNGVRGRHTHRSSVARRLGIRTTGSVQLAATAPPTRHVLARSGPIRLVAVCDGPTETGRLVLRSSAGSGSAIGVRYTQRMGDPQDPETVVVNVSAADVELAAADLTETTGVTFTATVGPSTLGGQASVVGGQTTCSFSFGGLAG